MKCLEVNKLFSFNLFFTHRSHNMGKTYQLFSFCLQIENSSLAHRNMNFLCTAFKIHLLIPSFKRNLSNYFYFNFSLLLVYYYKLLYCFETFSPIFCFYIAFKRSPRFFYTLLVYSIYRKWKNN